MMLPGAQPAPTLDEDLEGHRVALWLSPEGAAARLGVSRTRMYGLIDAGIIRSFKHGGRRYIHLQHLREDARRYADEGADQGSCRDTQMGVRHGK